MSRLTPLLLSLLMLLTACDGMDSVGAPRTRSARLRDARGGARVEWRQGDKALGKWRVDRRGIKVYDASLVLVGGVFAQRDPNNRLRTLRVEPFGAPPREIAPAGATWTLTTPDAVVGLEAGRVVLSDAGGQQRGAITRAGEEIIWTGFDQSQPLKASERDGQLVVEQGGAQVLQVRASHVEPIDALAQLIPGLAPLDRAALAMIVADWIKGQRAR